MKRVEEHEFQDNARKYLAANEPLAIERQGVTIGFYFPNPKADAERRKRLAESLAQLEETVQTILEETGMTEDELADLFDPNKPLPEHPIRRTREMATSNHASGD